MWIRNKPERLGEVRGVVARALDKGLAPHEAASLRGGFQFAEGQLVHRCAGADFSALGDRAVLARPNGEATPELRWALSWPVRFFESAPPRAVRARFEGPLVLVLTDGAYEGEGATCGGAAFVGSSEHPAWFELRVSGPILDKWRAFGPRNVIARSESLPVSERQGGVLHR